MIPLGGLHRIESSSLLCRTLPTGTKIVLLIWAGSKYFISAVTILTKFTTFRFLVHLLLSDRGWDAEVSRAYVLECFKRQVSWFLDPSGGKCRPGLAYLESEPISPYRLDTTFKVISVVLKLLYSAVIL